ncbi:MAG: nitroreductase family protein [Tissierellia bacterium]|nr:nitroreductase family protein [Tissierellia bacterium]
MLMNNFLKTRTSTRSFKNKEIKKDTVKKLYELLKEKSENLNNCGFLFNNNGDIVFEQLEGVGGYQGLMIKSPAYIALNTFDDNPKSYIEGSYHMEDLITELEELGLASCWISLKDVDETVKKTVFNYNSGKVDYALSIGYPQRNEIHENSSSDRIGIDKFVFIDDFYTPATIEELELRGLDDLFYYLRFAPSTYNKQPWRFVLDGDIVKLYTEDYSGVENLVDCGIIMYYFKKLAESLAIDTKWDIDPKLEDEKYQYIAETRI